MVFAVRRAVPFGFLVGAYFAICAGYLGLAACALSNLSASPFVDEVATWSLPVNGLQVVAAILLFLAEDVHHAWRYRMRWPDSSARTLRTISPPETWMADCR